MTQLESQIHILLQESGYETWPSALGKKTAIGFEDEVVMGFVYIFDEVESLLQGWNEIESLWLNVHAPSLQKAGEKTWNIYSVFLCPEQARSTDARRVRWIEEDLERTRKIAACGITTQEALIVALLPLLPLQYQPILDSEDFDLTQRLMKRVSDIAPEATMSALNPRVPATEIVRLLGLKK